MARCYICSREFKQEVTKYPDGKNPCPDCVDSYKEYKTEDTTEIPVFDSEEIETLDRLEIYNIPIYDYMKNNDEA